MRTFVLLVMAYIFICDLNPSSNFVSRAEEMILKNKKAKIYLDTVDNFNETEISV